MRLIAVSISLLLLIGCSQKEVHTELIMGTVAEISVWGDGRVADLGFREIKRIEEKFRKNDETDSEIEYLMEESFKYNEMTNGAFDIDYRHDGKYDFGGIAKGYAVDRVAQLFKEKGVRRAMINLGGNLYLYGKKSWSVGIKDPNNPNRLIGKLLLGDELGVATSANYERPGHIINPKTGKSVTHLLSVTIVAPTAMEADALSTGVFVLGKEKGIGLIEKLPKIEGVIIDNDGVWVSSGLEYESLY